MKHLTAFFRSPRLWGMLAVALGLYLLIFKVLGHLSVAWLINNGAPSRPHWPDLPYFYSHVRPAADSPTNREELIVVPTRQLTPAEIRQLNTPSEQQPQPSTKP